MSAGCDHILGSDLKPDSCGVCGGSNSTCKVVRGRFDKSRIHYGYNIVTTLPSNSTHVDIRQYGTSKDDNYLALRDEYGRYILNGEFVVSMFRKTIQFGGATIEYSGSNATIERINASKPIERLLFVEVLSVGSLQTPQITFEYATSVSSDDVGDEQDNNSDFNSAFGKPLGAWEKSEWEEVIIISSLTRANRAFLMANYFFIECFMR